MARIWIRVISVLEIIGGVVGIIFMIYGSVSSGFAFNVMVMIPFSTAIFVLSLVAGICLWRGSELGRKLSLVVQFIQLPKIVSSTVTFMFSFGFDMFAHVTDTNSLVNLGLEFRFFVDGQLFLVTPANQTLLGLSIPALIAIHHLWSYDSNIFASTAVVSGHPPPPEEYFRGSSESDSPE